ncbi:MAG: proton-conducting transporter membrane subunit [Flavobacterium sp.]
MNFYVQFLVWIPLLGFVLSLFISEHKEKHIANWARGIVLVQLLSVLALTIGCIMMRTPDLNWVEFSVLKTNHYEFFIDFYFDLISVVYLLVGAFLTLLVTSYSRYYLHREKGYKRFFNTVLFFFFGYNLTILSGNFETLFIGWEIIGLSSFLLIAFYRERYLPVKNAFKVYSVYRIGDVGFLLAMWASHHLFHQNITFQSLNNATLISGHLQQHSIIGFFIAMSLLVAAAAKSAQIPFSSWLPRAMEGPTPSSAIFYGSLSVHLGAFLMLRTYPFWEHQISARVIIAMVGLVTAILANYMAKVQPTVKSQVAYSSVTQIGIIFIEIAAGWEYLALFHFAGNAFLRTYQLLIAPSTVSYLIRDQFFHFTPRHPKLFLFPKKWFASLYVLSLKEFYLEEFLNVLLWKPLKVIGKSLNFLNEKRILYFLLPIYALGVLAYQTEWHRFFTPYNFLPELFALIGMVTVFKAFSERRNPFVAWLLLVFNHFWIALAVVFNDQVSWSEITNYLIGSSVMGVLGFVALKKLHQQEKHFRLNQYLGHVYEHPKFAFLFLLAVLGVTGFPITTTFIGEDLVFSHIESNQILLAFLVSSSFVVTGISGIRLYARLFLGPHIKTYHEQSYPSA